MNEIPPSPANVVSLQQVRAEHRLVRYQQRVAAVLETNKRAVGRLYRSGAIFTKDGSRAGRDLLLAHQHLLRIATLSRRLGSQGDVPPPRTAAEVDAIFDELDALLERTCALTQRTGNYLAKLQSE